MHLEIGIKAVLITNLCDKRDDVNIHIGF
jgi:hypothetical protein